MKNMSIKYPDGIYRNIDELHAWWEEGDADDYDYDYDDEEVSCWWWEYYMAESCSSFYGYVFHP